MKNKIPIWILKGRKNRGFSLPWGYVGLSLALIWGPCLRQVMGMPNDCRVCPW